MHDVSYSSVAGRTRTFILRLRRPALGPIELPQRNDSLHAVPRAGFEPAPVAGTVSETVASSAFRHRGDVHTRTLHVHRAGLEPASLRLKGGGSAFELSVLPHRRGECTGRDSNPQ